MEIRAGGPGQEPASVAVTMRTPGHDFELAVGFMVGEGLIHGRDEVASVRYCDLPPEEPQLYNVVSVFLTRPFDPAGAERRFYTTSSCGICGKASLDQVEVHCAAIPPSEPLPASVVISLPDCPPQGSAHLRADRRAPRRRAVRPRPGRRWPSGRTSAATTPSTSSSAGRCWPGSFPCRTGC